MGQKRRFWGVRTAAAILLGAWLGLAALAGCVTRPHSAVPSLGAVYVEEIEQMVAGGEALAAIPRIVALRSRADAPVAAATLDELRRTAISAVRRELERARNEQRYLDAAALVASLAILPDGGVAGDGARGGQAAPLIVDLYRSEVRRLAADGHEVSALAIGLPELEREELPFTEADLQELAGLAARVGNRGALVRIAQAASARGLAVRLPTLPPAPPFAEMLAGTVTVEVDRGLDVRGGVGVPDRVIGSGFFVDRHGHLLTNYHVIESEVDPAYEGYSRLFIRLSDQDDQKVSAKVVGYDRIFDLALLKTEVRPEYVFASAGAGELVSGAPVVAIGSPGGLAKTVTSGIVSATGRPFLQLGDALQVDAPLNPGNSGGPLLSQDGELVGVTYAGIEEFEGINFGIPYVWIQYVLPRLYRGGAVVHLWLGANVHRQAGELVVNYVVPGSPAAIAGLAVDDVLLQVGKHRVDGVAEVQRRLLGYHAPTLIELVVRRGGAERRLLASPGERPHLPLELALERDTRDRVLVPLFGFGVEQVGESLFGTDYRVTRVIPGSLADDTDIAVDDPVRVSRFRVDEEARVASLLITIKRRRGGFLESTLLLAVSLEQRYFL